MLLGAAIGLIPFTSRISFAPTASEIMLQT